MIFQNCSLVELIAEKQTPSVLTKVYANSYIMCQVNSIIAMIKRQTSEIDWLDVYTNQHES